MLGVSFPEIAVFLAVALMVLGPEKTLKASRSMGRVFTKIRNYLRECERELDLEDVRKAAMSVKGNLNDFRAAAARGLESSVNEARPGAEVKDSKSESQSAGQKTKRTWPKPPAYIQEDEIKDLRERVVALEQKLGTLMADQRK